MEKNNNNKFKVYQGDMPSDLIERLRKALAAYGLEIVKKDECDFYDEYEIEVLK